jgi:hypothetical protein
LFEEQSKQGEQGKRGRDPRERPGGEKGRATSAF